MDAQAALRSISDVVNEYASFAEGFDHEFHGDSEAFDPETGEFEDREGNCRFDLKGDPFEVIEKLITVARLVVDANGSETKFELDEAIEDLAKLV